MITVSVDCCNPISQKFYDDVIFSLQFHQLTCTCGHSACLTVHGYYNRFIKSDGSKVSLRICRLFCSCCGHTHALLLSSIIPYSQIPLSKQADIVSYISNNGDISFLLDSQIDESNVHAVIRQFRRHWKQKLLSKCILLTPLASLFTSCFSFFSRQFMQIKSTSNILFLRPT